MTPPRADAAPDADAPPCWCGERAGRPIARFPEVSPVGLRMLACSACGTARLLPPPDEATLAAAYARDYYGGRTRKFRGPVGALFARAQGGRARHAAALVPAGGRVLDVGCGAGEFLVAMRERGFRVEGTERSTSSAARAQAAGLTVHPGDLGALDLPPGAFDLVSFWHVLEHVRDPLATLVRAHALLRAGGRLLVALPNADSWQARVFAGRWFHHDPPRHLWAFGPRSLAALLRRTGFVPGRVHTFSAEQNPYGVLQSALNALGFPRDRAYDLLKGVGRGTAATRAADAALIATLAVPALVFALAEAAAGRGGTLVVAATRATAGAGCAAESG